MQITTRGRYAVMALVDLADVAGERPVSLQDVARRQEISLSYLEPLFAKLRRGQLVKSVRGPGGGYLLARPAGEIRVSDVMVAVDEPFKTTRCTPGSPMGCRANNSRCATHDLWEELGQQIHIFLSGLTIEDVQMRRVLGSASLPRPDPDAQPPTTHS